MSESDISREQLALESAPDNKEVGKRSSIQSNILGDSEKLEDSLKDMKKRKLSRNLTDNQSLSTTNGYAESLKRKRSFKVVNNAIALPVGMSQLEQRQQEHADHEMMENIHSTEKLVDQMLIALKKQKEVIQEDWPKDTFPHEHCRETLSYSKMINHLNHLEPRQVNKAMVVQPISICAKAGSHSTNEKSRSSELEELGEGIVLYLKLLKYLQCTFFILFLITVPTMIVFYSG